MELVPSTELGRYTVLRPLGAGGMGVVVLVRHRELGSLHAVKVLRADGPDVDLRLRQEGRLQATSSHPNVVRVTDLVMEYVDGRTGLVMEYVDGPTLAAYLAERRLLPFAEVDALARGLLRGVADAHDHGWVHRDLKPGNVLLHLTKDEIVPKVADFGLAKVLGGSGPADVGQTSRHGLGTRGYMPLQQLVGLPPDARMDVFALGAVLFELAVGRPAFPSVEAWQRASRSASWPDPDREGLPVRMRDAIRLSLAEREDRVPDARALLAVWSGESAVPEALRSSAHLVRTRLMAEPKTAAELAHLDGCVRCRSEARLARVWIDGESGSGTPSPETFGASSLGEPTPTRRLPRWVLLALGLVILGVVAAVGVARQPSDSRSAPVPAPSAPPPSPAPAAAAPVVLLPPPEAARVVVVRTPPARTARPPVGTATLIVNTIGGPAGRFQIDDGPVLRVGPPRKVRLAAGVHRVRVLSGGHDETVWEGPITLAPDEEGVVCWDLARRAACE